MNDVLTRFTGWATYYMSNLIVTALVLIIFMVINRLLLPKIAKLVSNSKLTEEARKKTYHTARLITGVITIALLLLVWGVDFSGLIVLSTSIIALTGVALFASWSLLSNITSYFVLLFQNSYSKGNFIRIIDGDNYMEGYIAEINLFTTRLMTKDGEEIAYPNNLVLTRPVIINPKQHWQSIGKSTDKNLATQPGENAVDQIDVERNP
ncbi:mechanosensitive ion channel family protein [Alteromonas lipolytica]|uniref:Small-conductance mechanosensitive channel n=1 Tax=Alteromonas lipolytica TaxID=1856405 RepID=A0A1E8FE63_9ALTE|nr:mechanosensitive ion channel domain-containing protein [Alteromonas lipolytica]OFI34225.1 mechanosensitive ion channel protein MscS [Alteromonas lipolytica]GGF83982.1 mechanosensitive ion channel protein [Alteromonas lipolytica]